MSRATHRTERLALAVVLAVLAVAPRASASPVRADGIAAYVGGSSLGPSVIVILLSDVELRAHLERAARGESVGGAPLSAEELRRAFDPLVGESLLVREAERLQFATADEQALEREWQQLFAQVGGAERLDALRRRIDVDASELEELVRRRAVARAFTEANLAGSEDVSEAAVERAYERGDHPFVGEELDVVREALRMWLARRAVQQAMLRWIELLAARTPVHVMSSFASRVAAPAS